VRHEGERAPNDGIAVFEAVHGEAADLVGKDFANPLTLVGSAVLMLDHLGEAAAARAIDAAIQRVLTYRKEVTRDLGDSARTIEVAKAIAATLRPRRSVSSRLLAQVFRFQHQVLEQ